MLKSEMQNMKYEKYKQNKSKKRKIQEHIAKRKSYQEKKKKIINISKLIENRKINLALKAINEYIEIYSVDCYLIHQYGMLYMSEHNLSKAKEYFLKNVEDDSDNKYYSMYEIGMIEKNKYNYKEALKYFDEIININCSNKCYALLEKAKIYKELERYNESEEILLRIINDEDKNYQYAIEEIIELYIETNNISKARSYLEKLKSFNSTRYKMLEGKILKEEKSFKKAKEIFEEIKPPNKNYNKAQYELALMEFNLLNYEESLKILNRLKYNETILFSKRIFLYIDNYLSLGMPEKALEYIEKLKKFGYIYRDNYYYFIGKVEMLNKNYELAYKYYSKVTPARINTYNGAKLQKVFCLIKQEKITEAYKDFKEFQDIKMKDEYDKLTHTMLVYFNKELNLNMNIKSEMYVEKMIENYDLEKVIKHISKHKYYDSKKLKHSTFIDGIDINELLKYAYENIGEENYIYNNFTDCYIIRCDKIGIENEKNLNYLKVITLPNTKKIVTLYPSDKMNLSNTLEETEQKEKVKKISQIEKFNKKYNI